MKRVFETAECEAVIRNSIFWELRYEKHENQMKGCGMLCHVCSFFHRLMPSASHHHHPLIQVQRPLIRQLRLWTGSCR